MADLIPITREAWEALEVNELGYSIAPHTLGLRVVDGVVVPKRTAKHLGMSSDQNDWDNFDRSLPDAQEGEGHG